MNKTHLSTVSRLNLRGNKKDRERWALEQGSSFDNQVDNHPPGSVAPPFVMQMRMQHDMPVMLTSSPERSFLASKFGPRPFAIGTPVFAKTSRLERERGACAYKGKVVEGKGTPVATVHVRVPSRLEGFRAICSVSIMLGGGGQLNCERGSGVWKSRARESMYG